MPKEHPNAGGSYDERIVAALDKVAPQKLEVLSFLAGQMHEEQSHYWNRFAALAALHAGLLVVAVETPPWASLVTSGLGIYLVYVWWKIQERSLGYVERLEAGVSQIPTEPESALGR